MKDANGRQVKVGDRVKLWENRIGTVVCSMDTREFSRKYSEADWGYLSSGVLIEADTGELFQYDEPDEDFEIIDAS